MSPAALPRLQARMHRGAAWCRSLAADVRSLQLAALHDSIQTHMAHPAMPVADPLTESLYAQLEGPAEEGAQPASQAGAGLTPAQRQALAADDADPDAWLLWVWPVGLVLGLAASALYPWGAA